MEEDKVSIVVPVYKVQQYLDRCIKSLIDQSYKNTQIILVDDGSTDRCPQICDQWSKKDSRIIVIHKKNGGLSDARNEGMKIADGEFTLFVDSDDWIHHNMIKIMVAVQKNTQTDIVECRAKKCGNVVEEKKYGMEELRNLKSFTTEKALQALINEMPLCQTVWNKLYKTRQIKDLLFPFGKYHEDEYWTYQAIAKSKSIVFIEAELYFYFQREDSIMGEQFSLRRLDALEGRYQRYIFISKNYPALEFEAKCSLFFLILYFGQKALISGDDKTKTETIKVLKSYIQKCSFLKTELRQCDFKNKFWIWLSSLSVDLSCKLRNFLKVGV